MNMIQNLRQMAAVIRKGQTLFSCLWAFNDNFHNNLQIVCYAHLCPFSNEN